MEKWIFIFKGYNLQSEINWDEFTLVKEVRFASLFKKDAITFNSERK